MIINLSPYEKNRIIPKSFGVTEMGRALLCEDYLLKQITASLIYPEEAIGKKFWNHIYNEVQKKFGTTNVPVNTFNKVWIIPEKAVVFENAKAGTAYVVESKLKVMLEEDYLSFAKHEGVQSINSRKLKKSNVSGATYGNALDAINGVSTHELGSQIVREVLIPELEKEVNENKNFAPLRQVYNSLILATWYKMKIKESILSQVYINKNKVDGINIDDPAEKEKIYQRYLKSFRKGVFNYIKEDIDLVTQEMKSRKYFSGGMRLGFNNPAMNTNLSNLPVLRIDHLVKPVNTAEFLELKMDMAMTTIKTVQNLFSNFWLGRIKEVDITNELGSNFYYGRFNVRFRFGGDGGYKPGDVPIGIGYGEEGDRAWMIRTQDGDIVFECRRGNEVMAKAVWGKEGEKWIQKSKIIASAKMFAQRPFWLKEIKSMDITAVLGKASIIKGRFNAAFYFEGEDGFKPGTGAYIGIGKGQKDDRVVINWDMNYKNIIFERHRDEKIIKSALWYKVGGEWKTNEIRKNKSTKAKAFSDFWSGTTNQTNITKELGRGVISGYFNAAFRFGGEDGYMPGYETAIGIGKGKVGDQVLMVREGEEIIFKRIRDGVEIISAGWGNSGNKWKRKWKKKGSEIKSSIETVKNKTILFEDSDQILLSKLKLILESKNYEVLIATGLRQVQRILKDRNDVGLVVAGGKIKVEILGNRKFLDTSKYLDRNEEIVFKEQLRLVDDIENLFPLDNAQFSADKGGIDLSVTNMNFQTKNGGVEIQFHINPAMLAQLQNAPGFLPVITNIQPLKNLYQFLGLI